MSKFDNIHLWESLPFKAWGLLVSFTLTEKEVRIRKERVMRILERFSWDSIIKTEMWTIIDLKYCVQSRKQRIFKLLEENSILSDALSYLTTDLSKNWRNINDIKKTITRLRFKADKTNMLYHYNFVDLVIWEIINDLIEAINDWIIEPSDKAFVEFWELIKERDLFIDPLDEQDDIIYS